MQNFKDDLPLFRLSVSFCTLIVERCVPERHASNEAALLGANAELRTAAHFEGSCVEKETAVNDQLGCHVALSSEIGDPVGVRKKTFGSSLQHNE